MPDGSAPESVGAFARLVLEDLSRTNRVGHAGIDADVRRSIDRPGSSRALAWDTALQTSSSGTRMNPSAIGHTGFTETSLWIDWERDFYAVC
jgi:hypothetical protein